MNADRKIILVLLFSAKQSFAAKGHSTIAIEIKIRKDEIYFVVATYTSSNFLDNVKGIFPSNYCF